MTSPRRPTDPTTRAAVQWLSRQLAWERTLDRAREQHLLEKLADVRAPGTTEVAA